MSKWGTVSSEDSIYVRTFEGPNLMNQKVVDIFIIYLFIREKWDYKIKNSAQNWVPSCKKIAINNKKELHSNYLL